jgi:hypothetical protein
MHSCDSLYSYFAHLAPDRCAPHFTADPSGAKNRLLLDPTFMYHTDTRLLLAAYLLLAHFTYEHMMVLLARLVRWPCPCIRCGVWAMSHSSFMNY